MLDVLNIIYLYEATVHHALAGAYLTSTTAETGNARKNIYKPQ